jgi:hypothetical protein
MYQPIAVIQGITGMVYGRGGQQTGQRIDTARDRDTWVYECVHCGFRFQTDNQEFNNGSQL